MAKLTQVGQGSIHTFLLKLQTDLKIGYVASLCLSCLSSLDIPVVFFSPERKQELLTNFSWKYHKLVLCYLFKGVWLIKMYTYIFKTVSL